MFRKARGRILFALFLLPAFALATLQPAPAALTTFLSGVVTIDGAPAPDVDVQASGSNVVLHAHTDARGRFAFSTLPVGTYTVSASAGGATGAAQIDLSSAGGYVTLALLKEVGKVTVVRAPALRGSGTDLTLNQEFLTRSPSSGSLPQLLVQLPGAAKGANGVVHINGDHGDINYVVDGVSIPQELNRNIGTEFDPNDVAYIEVLQGAYPAQYGERFASVVNIDTRTGIGGRGVDAALVGGSYAHYDSALGWHQPVGTGSMVVAVRDELTDRALDPPDFDSPHNRGSNTNQFLRLTLPRGNDFLNFTLSNSYRTFQIPNDVEGGQPAGTDDSETQADTFASLQFRHAIGDHGALSFGPSYKRSRIRDFGDPANDWTYGEALNLASGGSATDCANSLANPSLFLPTTCGYTLFGDRTAQDYKFNADYALRSNRHEIRAGAFYDDTQVAKNYAVTLQPNSFLGVAPVTVVDNAPNNGHTEAAYVQDSWRMGDAWELDYGLRADAFQLTSTEFARAFGQLSPRLKLTRFFTPRSSLYAYYGRFFTPFSFENVSPSAAQTLNLPLQTAVAQFDLKPQRDSNYEVGGHLPLAGGDLGLRVMRKNATDLIDDTQVGVTLLHQDINYQLGRIATESAYYQHPLQRNGRVYVSLNHTYSVNKGCETQLLAPCFGSPTDWTPADHEQRWGATSGVLFNDNRNGWFALDAEYGSGLSSAACPPTTSGFCKMTPHTIFDVEKAFALPRGLALTLRIDNLLNDRYYVTFANAQGNHFAPPRTFDLGFRFSH
ncbi:MAG: TonB-dependent receptor [Candidatus Eremiobacteraeota bacterium]|nr:TonB-dependent receptor [Candidatus Eremiobacteraeota bacterium]